MKSRKTLQYVYIKALTSIYVDVLVICLAFVLEYLFAMTAAVFSIPLFVVSADLWSCVTLAGTSLDIPALSCSVTLRSILNAVAFTMVCVPNLYLRIAITGCLDTIATALGVAIQLHTLKIPLFVDYFQNFNIDGVLRRDSAVLGVLQRATSTATIKDDEAGI